MKTFICKRCHGKATCDYDDDNEGTNLCYDCFEGALEEHEERKRERIARANEY